MKKNNHWKVILSLSAFLLITTYAFGQKGSIKGIVKTEGDRVEFAQVSLEGTTIGTSSNKQGEFIIRSVPFGEYKITASFIGYAKVTKEIQINENQKENSVEFNLTEHTLQLENLVVTGTKTYQRQTDSPVIVNVVSKQILENVQACNLAEGLKFQPGLRVETNCQTCNYTQLRMNGMAGAYSQILINGRPIFSPLTGLYGLEQIPANMIERIEVVRGGGSSLYGSSAIGGTVNVITKIPKTNSYELNYTYQHIDGQTNDNTLSGNSTIVSDSENSGISFFFNHRDRDFYDANKDNFSEIPIIKNTSIGTNLFILPSENQKIELNLSYIDEYRFGGEMLRGKPAFFAEQSEERTHYVWMASADYQLNFNEDQSSFITYLAWQQTDRKHYTGIQPDKETVEYKAFLENPPYGTSDVSTYTIGTQLNHKNYDFFNSSNVFTLGAEYVFDDVIDEISTYSYLIDQTTRDIGLFLQSDWRLTPKLTLLSGVRMDNHNLVDKPIFSPRASLMYTYKENTQIRFSFGTGFRAPQAFDTDLHIAFAGGGISRISLSPDLTHERSRSFSTSINYDKAMEKWIAGYTIEGFYNQIKDAFYLEPIGQDQFGERFEKQNGAGAVVKGFTLEVRANYNAQVQLESGFTLQTSRFDEVVEYIDGVPGIRDFIRTPNDYAYAVLTLTPKKQINMIFNYIYTGKMKVPHFAGAPNQTVDEIVTTDSFSELSAKVSYSFGLQNLGVNLEIYSGVKNMFNRFQNDFDIGKNRDSNYIYGPSQPRTIYFGFKLR